MEPWRIVVLIATILVAFSCGFFVCAVYITGLTQRRYGYLKGLSKYYPIDIDDVAYAFEIDDQEEAI